MESYIGENIKRLRRQKDITQETLAERMDVSAAAVSKWERGLSPFFFIRAKRRRNSWSSYS